MTSRLHPRWIPKTVYLSWLPPDVLGVLGGYLAPREIDRLEEAFVCRPDRRSRGRRGPREAEPKAPRPPSASLGLRCPWPPPRPRPTPRELVIAECRARGQFAAPRESVLQSLRAARVAWYAPGRATGAPASYLEWLPVELLDPYLPYEALVAVERALTPPDEPWEQWGPEAEGGAPGQLSQGAKVSGARPGATPRLSARQKQERGRDRRARRRKAQASKPWAAL